MTYLKNKKANVTEVILVLGVIIIFGLLFLSFSISSSNTKSSLSFVGVLEKIHFEIEKFFFYQEMFKLSEEQSSKFTLPINTDANGRFLDFVPSSSHEDGGISQIKFYIK